MLKSKEITEINMEKKYKCTHEGIILTKSEWIKELAGHVEFEHNPTWCGLMAAPQQEHLNRFIYL
jgi:hypothetical protein